jgi:serine/threonine-protein kinase
MLFPEPQSPREDHEAAADGSSNPPPADPAGPLIKSPTGHHGVGSSARKTLAASAHSVVAPAPLPVPGDVINGYLLEEAIGAGGMGAVFRARDTQLDREVALKLLPPEQASDPEIVPRFYQEGRSAARLDHENIARVFNIGHDGTYHYIAFEFIEGSTVRQRVEQSGLLPISEAVHIALQIAQALVHAAARGVVHRDIKPSNMIIRPDGQVKLVDMGLARRFERGGDHGLTQSGMTLGTFDYISPEQARDPRDVDVRSDLYSLGCTLFHMLAGRPPFPGGTALQKLIQHHEEAPPDVRTLNPAVPALLAGVIAKLMAKDRDRRYQTPEHLVRDLLGVAGAIGLAPAFSPHSTAPGDDRKLGWERPLAWLIPALGLVAVVTALGWWGEGLARPFASSSHSGPAVISERAEAAAASGAGGERSSTPRVESAAAETTKNPPAYLRSIPVNSNDDLMETLATAPPRSVILLSDDGPFRLGGRAWSYRSSAPLTNVDLTIKAEAGVRPVLKFDTKERSADTSPSCLLQFIGGHVTIEGVEFELDAEMPDEAMAAIRTEATELTVRGCSFRRAGAREGRNVAALHVRTLRSLAAPGDRPPAVLADSCHFDGAQTGVLAEGPVEIMLRDCTMGPAEPSIWLDNRRSSAPVPSELHVIHTSVLAGPGPVFRFDGSQARIWIDDSVVAAAGPSAVKLVTIDNPQDLAWRGRSNLYDKIGVYLDISASGERQEPVTDFERWADGPLGPREVKSVLATASVWDAADPSLAQASETDNPTRAFLLSTSIAARMDVGARRGPFGSILQNVRAVERPRTDVIAVAAPPARALASDSSARTSPEPAKAKDDKPAVPEPMPVTSAAADSSLASNPDDPMSLPPMPPMPSPATVVQASSAGSAPAADSASSPPAPLRRDELPRRTGEPSTLPGPGREREPITTHENLVRDADQFTAILDRLGKGGGTIRIAAGAEIDLSAITIDGTGQYQVLAEPGTRRPRLRFRPGKIVNRRPADWAAMLNLRTGSLHLQGIDLVVPEEESIPTSRVATIGVLPGCVLTATDCTFTLAASRSQAALFVVQPEIAPGIEERSAPAPASSAVIRIRDSFLRSAGDGIAVATSRRLQLELANVLASTEASLLHAFGDTRPGRADAPALKLRIDHVTARVKGGLVHLDSTPDEPELAFAAIVAENSIISTANRDDPLLRVDGRDQLDELGDKIHWEARRVAYDRIKTYRRDEVVRTGVSPRLYDRANWASAFLPKDESPILADIKYLKETDPSQAAWKCERNDLRLAPQNPVSDLGPDISRIPEPPPAGEL